MAVLGFNPTYKSRVAHNRVGWSERKRTSTYKLHLLKNNTVTNAAVEHLEVLVKETLGELLA